MSFKELVITQGKTFSLEIRWELDTIIYKPITGISQTAPARITVTNHGIPDGWRGAVTNVKGMTEINAEANQITERDYRKITVVDENTVELNAVNAAGFRQYVSGGYLQFNKPVDLSGYVARMKIKDRTGGVILASTEAADAPNNIISATINQETKKILIVIPASKTELIPWTTGVYEIEMSSQLAVVDSVLNGTVKVVKEIVTP